MHARMSRNKESMVEYSDKFKPVLQVGGINVVFLRMFKLSFVLNYIPANFKFLS